jgi:DNA-binding CsgD family transcriptional regulator
MFTIPDLSASNPDDEAFCDRQADDRRSSILTEPTPKHPTPKRNNALPERVVREMAILDAMHLGVIVVSSELKLVYRNLKAQAMCQAFWQESEDLPQRLVYVGQQFVAESDRLDPNDPLDDPFVWECYPVSGQKLHIQLSWMAPIKSLPNQPYMLIVIKDCYEDLMAKTRRDQKSYGFTDREAQIWMMLDLACTYQEIAESLGITVNTVKTHVKNINVKRRNKPQRSRLWFVDDQN